MPSSGYSPTARVFFVFACIGAILVFLLAYLLGSRPVDYGTNLQARLTQVGLKLSQCKEQTRRWTYKDNKAKRGEASTSDEVAELETEYEKLTATHEECESTSQSLSEGLEKCREDILNMGTLIQDKEFEANATTISRLKKLARTKDGNVGTFVTQMEAGADVEKKELIRGLLRDVAEKRLIIQKVVAACRAKKQEERKKKQEEKEAKEEAEKKEESKKKDKDADEEKPKKKKSSDDDEEKPKKKTKKTDDDDDEKTKKKKSSEDEDEKPKKKKKKSADDEDEKPKKKKSDDDDEKPKKKSAEADEEKPKQKKSDSSDDKADEKKEKKE
eukprot:NODE_1725_length_1319_cov_24.532283_g1247_i1.p1 GENE.NODE_1725_length_1319_cov_24.532283_g1247_i1~~NODE_1725_length_1319_cov_24.532283_g1247_i1.p1  ORF type:complete len:329 (+),score=191.17 NODE_1725_length_1319_cov_24.532283_g1247_i1:169-1155(+)